MIYYRQNRVTKQLFRRVDSVPEEFMPEDREWKLTGDAIAAFHDSSDTSAISEKTAIEVMERQARAAKGSY
ncbi:MAG TPA: hypothetical protein PLY58_03965 [Bacilli bacterium]|nr:hypothetical protein [Bacilli bacterium]